MAYRYFTKTSHFQIKGNQEVIKRYTTTITKLFVHIDKNTNYTEYIIVKYKTKISNNAY